MVSASLPSPSVPSLLFMKAFRTPSSTAPSINICVFWFRNDLRLTDNEPLARAIRASEENPNTILLPFFCFDPRFLATPFPGNGVPDNRARSGTTDPFNYGSLPNCTSQKSSSNRARFLSESVLDLRDSFEKQGGKLTVGYGKTEEVLGAVLKTLVGPLGRVDVFCQEEVTREEKDIEAAVVLSSVKNGGSFHEVWVSGV